MFLFVCARSGLYVGSGSLTRGLTPAPRIGSLESATGPLGKPQQILILDIPSSYQMIKLPYETNLL